jgi:pseudaminic acid synthase
VKQDDNAVMGNFAIDSRLIGDRSPVFVIAELSCNHLGSLDTALATVRAAKDAGADAIKFQHYTPDSLTLPIRSGDKGDFWMHGGTEWDGDWLYNLYARATTPWEWTEPLTRLAREINLIWFSSPFDGAAVDLLQSVDCPAYKIASFEMNDPALLQRVAETGKPVIFSTGMARSLEQITATVQRLRDSGCRDVGILKCLSAYPAVLDELHLDTIRILRETFRDDQHVIIGLSDHSADDDVIVASVALGARVIERHIILDKTLRDAHGQLSADVTFSLEPREFHAMVEKIRKAEKIVGDGTTGLSLGKSQKKNLQFTRSLYFAADLPAGTVLTAAHVRSVRPGWGDDPVNLPRYIGRKLKAAVTQGTRASLDLLEPE